MWYAAPWRSTKAFAFDHARLDLISNGEPPALALEPQASMIPLQFSKPSGITGGTFSVWYWVTAGRGPCGRSASIEKKGRCYLELRATLHVKMREVRTPHGKASRKAVSSPREKYQALEGLGGGGGGAPENARTKTDLVHYTILR